MATHNDTVDIIIEDDRITWEVKLDDNEQTICYYCNRMLNNKCYTFCQTQEEFHRDIRFVVCNDECQVGLEYLCNSTCKKCNRVYIHNRYDNDICISCTGNNEL